MEVACQCLLLMDNNPADTSDWKCLMSLPGSTCLKKKKNFISITCYISSAYILKYMIQSVIDGKNQKTNMSVYDIPLQNKINI